MKEKKTILIAGGSGIVGRALQKELINQGYEVRVLTRKEKPKSPYYHWDPARKEIDTEALKGVDVLINLAGEGIADKRWNAKRKQEIIDSRVHSTRYLFELSENMPALKQFITASGITCYGFDDAEKAYCEDDPLGNDYLSQVVREWEKAADLFQTHQKVAKVRTGIVLTLDGGAFVPIEKTVKSYIGAPLGRGGQIMPWISIRDIARVYAHIVNNELEGAYNAFTENVSNAQLTNRLATYLERPLWLPKVPKFALKLALGEMAEIALNGVHVDNTKLKNTGFEFKDPTLEDTFQYLYEGD